MPKTKTSLAFAAGLTFALGSIGAHAQSADAVNTLKIGYAGIAFNTASGDLTGPPGTTPPGIQVDTRDARTVSLIYARRISGPWSVIVQAGAPPKIQVDGAGTGAALGSVATATAWFPAVLATYTFTGPAGIRPYVGAGVNYAFFTDRQLSRAYTSAFGGTSSSATLKDSRGPVVKLGAECSIAKNWVLDIGYSHYWIKTKATITTTTPGVGAIARTINAKVNPDTFGLAVGYRF